MENNLDYVVSDLIREDNFCILTHQYPDGDTLGSATALCLALQKLGKNCKVLTSGMVPDKYNFLFDSLKVQNFDINYVISVDVADTKLLGEDLMNYAGKIDLCIDHHGSNRISAKSSLIDPKAAAAAEVIYKIILKLKVDIDKNISNSIYTGIATDTGCFRYPNTTPGTHKIAAEMMKIGADFSEINREMFEVKSLAGIEIEQKVINTTKFFCNGRCALVYLTNDMIRASNACDNDIENLASIPRRVRGVEVGVMMREKENGIFKISVRTNGKIDASVICSKFGGGGHSNSAGCSIEGGLEIAKTKIISEVTKYLGDMA